MKINKAKKGDVMVVAPSGQLDMESRQLFGDELLGLVDTGETAIVVDMSDVGFVTSIGLSALLTVAQRLADEKGKFALCSISDDVNNVFEVSGFSTIFDIYPDVDAALKGLG